MNPSSLIRKRLDKRRKILVKNGTILTMDKKNRVVKDGLIFIDEGRIVQIAKDEKGEKPFDPEYVIDANSKIVIPGLIDTHIHLAQALLRGTAEDMPLIEWLSKRIWPLQGIYSEKEGLISSALCMVEMIKSGTSTFLESGLHKRYGNDSIAELLSLSGMRGILSKMIMDGAGYGKSSNIMHHGMIEEKEECLKEAGYLHSRWNGKDDGRIGIWLAARSLGAVSEELFDRIAEMAKKLNTGITMHLNEVKEDSEYSMQNYGVPPVVHMKNHGILGKRRVFAHMVWATDQEISLLAKSGSSVSHCPSSNLKLGSGIARVPEMINMGVNVSMGCDGAPCNNTYDMIREMKIASIIQKGRLLNAKVMNAEDVLKMATLNGAFALGLDKEIGSLEEGKRADIAIVDTTNEHCIPSFDPIATLVYSCSGCDVDTLIVDGRIIMNDRRILTLDEEKIINEARIAASELFERADVKTG